jgi:hypothetical protein
MLGLMPGASTLLTCFFAFSYLGALAAPTPAQPFPQLGKEETAHLEIYAHYAGAAYCHPNPSGGHELGGK